MDVAVQVLRAALALVFLGMGVSHFIPSVRRGMRAMVPPRLASHRAFLVAFTGVCELAVAVVVPAIGNAIPNASGDRVRALPITADA